MNSVIIMCLYSVLVASTVTAIGDPVSKFERTCTHNDDCTFRNSQAKDDVLLKCSKKKCICRNIDNPLMDSAFFIVEDVVGKCLGGSGLPCGESNGIKLGCKPGRTCIEGRCRATSEIRSAPKGWSCNEDIDCVRGLLCKHAEHSFPPMTRCQNP